MSLQSLVSVHDLLFFLLEFLFGDGVRVIELVEEVEAFDLTIEVLEILIVVLGDLREWRGT